MRSHGLRGRRNKGGFGLITCDMRGSGHGAHTRSTCALEDEADCHALEACLEYRELEDGLHYDETLNDSGTG